jgi:hypothetical protein
MMAANSVDSAQYVDGSIDTAHIANSQITVAKMAANSVDSAQYVDDSIDTAHYAAGSVDTTALGADSVTAAKIGDNVINSEHYAADSIDTEHYAAGSVDATALASNAVTSAKINADAVTGAKIADNAINSEHYTDASIDTAHYAAGSVDATALGADSVTAAKIGDNVINSEHYAAASIDNEHLADDAVNSDELAAGAVDDAHLSDGVATGLAGAGTTATSGVINVIGGDGITANANDIAITAAQTTITSIFATDLKIGEDAQTAIDFETANEIHLDANNAEVMNIFAKGVSITGNVTASGNLNISGSISSSGTGSFRYVETDALINRKGDANTGLQFSSDTVSIQGNNVDVGVFASNRIEFNKPISSSGIISASGFTTPLGTVSAATLTLGANIHQIADGAEITDTSENTIIEFADDAITFSCGSTTINGIATIAKRKWARSSTANNNLTQGDITFTGGEGTIATGDIVYMDTSGNWQKAQANSLTKSKGILGIALGNNAGVNGILLRGMFTLDHDVGNNQGIPLFLSDTTAGQAIIAAPDTSGDIVRIIGYNLGNDDQIWFSPDNTFVEVA